MGSKGEKHLSRLAMPKSWRLKRKATKWIARPLPGPHPIKLGLPLVLVLRDILKYANTTKEVKKVLHNQEILVDGIRRKEPRFIVGLMDVIAIPKLSSYFRVLLNKKGKIIFIPIKDNEANIKPCKIIGKKIVKGKIQLNLFDGKNILVEKGDYQTRDSLLIELPSQKIKELLKFQKGNTIYLTAGKNTGETGVIEEIKGDRVLYKRDNMIFETLKDCVFVIGKEKPLIRLLEK